MLLHVCENGLGCFSVLFDFKLSFVDDRPYGKQTDKSTESTQVFVRDWMIWDDVGLNGCWRPRAIFF